MAFHSVSIGFTIGQPVNPLRSLPDMSRARSIADDDYLFAGSRGFVNRALDSDYEGWTWPEEIDQSRIGLIGYGRFADDDLELDDGI